ncbi:MAG TPA: Gfo/Idh/MocA family protein [Candidatus Wujingus californicus]|uniref:Gfo/Idh/MocA family protein n=1 Tax=Candidatus Wujingus californicus TaxID=3367618 RepID=UPI001D452449|nr:Gfo/Idh/MocA family oxidoreductase [Planctomycetota bacterium]
MNILIIGTGMYVCGRGTDGYGTILPAIYEWKREHRETGNIYIAGSHLDGIKVLNGKINELNKLFGFDIKSRYFPENEVSDSEAFIKAIHEIAKPACAIVAVPDNLHRKIAGYTIENGLHTLVVKPLASTIQEVIELIELQQRHGVYCAVEFHKRLDLANLKLRDTIKSGKVGDPLYFVVEYSQRKSIPTERFKSWVETTNIFQYLGIHYVDIVYFSTRAIPQRLIAVGQKNWLLKKGINTYDSIQVVAEWVTPAGNKFTSSFFTNWIDPENTSAMSDQKIKVIGTKGRYEADQKRRGIYMVTDKKGIEEPNPDFCSMYGNKTGEISFQGYGIDSVLQFLKDVMDIESGVLEIDALEDKRPTFRDAIIPTIVIEAANRSLVEDGKWIQTKFVANQFVSFD